MKIYLNLIALCLLLGASCADPVEPKVKKGVITVNQMRYIMWDLFMADEYYMRMTINDTLNKKKYENLRLYDQVFRSYGISKQKFYDSYKYYASHPDLYKVLIDSVDGVAKKQRVKVYELKAGKLK